MSIFDKLMNRKPVIVENAEPNTIHDIGVDDVNLNTNDDSIDWIEKNPDLVIPSVINLRKCAETPLVHGILYDFVIKSISGFVITGSDEKAVEYIQEQDKRWNLSKLFYEVLLNNFITGIDFYQKVIEDNQLSLRQLAFDGQNYRMKELYDETGQEIIGYMQRVLINENTNKGWIKRHFFDMVDSNKTEKTVHFEPDEITAPSFFRRHGKVYSMVQPVMDTVYMIELLKKMMPQIVYKNANTLILTIGNKDRTELDLASDKIDKVADIVADYHKKGVVTLPYGVSPDMIGDNVLPKIEDYIKRLTSDVYAGLVSPEAIFSSSSSNRSTAVVQLDSDKSGRVLMQEYLQECISRWVEKEVFDVQLELGGYETGTVWIDFNVPVEENMGSYLDDGAGNVQKREEGIVDEGNQPNGTNLESIRNTQRGVE